MAVGSKVTLIRYILMSRYHAGVHPGAWPRGAGLVLAEVDSEDRASVRLPEHWDVLSEVTRDERFTGARLAQADKAPTPLG